MLDFKTLRRKPFQPSFVLVHKMLQNQVNCQNAMHDWLKTAFNE